jgi:hypothetical protein
MSPPLRPVRLASTSLFCPAGIGAGALTPGRPGPVPGFQPRSFIPDRKHIKLMGRAVQLGVAAVREALDRCPGWEAVPPERRALFVGASPQAGDADDLRPALDAAWDGEALDLQRFAAEGIPRIHPLWLVRGLSNNVLGFASAAHDMQGTNRNYCDGAEGGWTALTEAWWAVAEGRADLAVAGGADSFIGAEPIFGAPCGEGAAFAVFVADAVGPAGAPCPCPERGGIGLLDEELGLMGAASWPVAWVRARTLQT